MRQGVLAPAGGICILRPGFHLIISPYSWEPATAGIHMTRLRIKRAFNVCNIGLEVSKDIVITDRFSIPVTGQLIFNPDSETMFLVVGFTL